MAGSDSSEIQEGFIEEVTVNTTPATPAFTLSSFENLSMQGNPRLNEAFPRSAGGARLGVGKAGYTVTGSGNGPLYYGEYDSFFETLFQAAWSTDVLTDGKGQQTLTIEQGIPAGAGGAMNYTRFRGVEAVGGFINIVAGENVQVGFDLIAQSREDATASIIAGATYVAPAVTDIITSGSEIGTIVMTTHTLDCIANINIDWGVTGKVEQPQVGSDDACGISRGSMRPSINGQFYVEANFVDLYNASVVGAADFSLTIPLGSVTTEKYTIVFPACQFVSTPLATQAEGPAFIDFEILPQYDAGGIDATCQITRAIA